MRCRHFLSFTPRFHPLLLGACLLGSTAPAFAQSVEGEFSVQRLDPAPGPRNFVTTRGARVEGEMSYSAGFLANYGSKPFVVTSCESATSCSDPVEVNVVEHILTGDLMGTLTPIDRLQLGLRVPISFTEGDGLDENNMPDIEGGGISGTGLGDIELEAKGRIIGEPSDPITAGAALFGTAPTGTATAEGNFIGDDGVTGGLRGIFDASTGPVSFGVNAAYLLRGKSKVGDKEIGSEFRYSAAAGFRPSPIVRVVAELFGASAFSNKGSDTLEGLGALQINPSSAFMVTAGGGLRLVEGVGAPVYRALVGLTFSMEGGDKDGDGIADSDDQCVLEAEDFDGYEDSDGCPDKDNDGDLIPDDGDRCPNEAEDPDGFEDLDGCPELDNDKDGINDNNDRCPDQPETKNGYRDDDGCPDVSDVDNDGVPDDKDQCKDQPEDTDGFQDTDGCPDPDNDGDGIPDERDECVDQPETVNGFQDEDGCPDQAEGEGGTEDGAAEDGAAEGGAAGGGAKEGGATEGEGQSDDGEAQPTQ